MKDVVSTTISFLAFYGLQTKSVHLKTTPNGQIESCSGDLVEGPSNSRHRKLIEREFEEGIQARDFRFNGRKLTIEEKRFSITIKNQSNG
jgi:hypothetical protein